MQVITNILKLKNVTGTDKNVNTLLMTTSIYTFFSTDISPAYDTLLIT